MRKYKVKEIFGPTIMGEGSNAGMVTLFLRFSGCNKWTGQEKDKPQSICSYCDTDFLGGDLLTGQDIVSKLTNLGHTDKVVLTGGEPLLQLDLDLLKELKQAGFKLFLETNGSKPLPDDMRNLISWITVSPKQSPEETLLKKADDLKVLFPPIRKDITPESFKAFEATQKWLQPIEDKDLKENTSNAITWLYNHPNWKLSLQIHKLLGVK